jgi:hypothetical protein
MQFGTAVYAESSNNNNIELTPTWNFVENAIFGMHQELPKDGNWAQFEGSVVCSAILLFSFPWQD